MEKQMTVHLSRSPLLRAALLADAGFSGIAGLAMVAGVSSLASLMNLPGTLVKVVGLFLIPYAVFMAFIGTRTSLPSSLLALVVIGNAGWALLSLVLLGIPKFAPNGLGIAFIVLQALVVTVFAALQYRGWQLARPHLEGNVA
jgi:hypothetical protein